MAISNAGDSDKIEINDKNKQDIGLKMNSVETRTAHSRARWVSCKKLQTR